MAYPLKVAIRFCEEWYNALAGKEGMEGMGKVKKSRTQ